MVSRFGLGIRTVTSGLTGTDRSREDTSSARPARQRRRTSDDAWSFVDETPLCGDGESQERIVVGITRTIEYGVAYETDGRTDSASLNHC